MGFRASKVKIKGEHLEKDISPFDNEIKVELSKKELELLLVTIKNSLFKGEYVETLYNLTLKLQNSFVSFKDKN